MPSAVSRLAVHAAWFVTIVVMPLSLNLGVFLASDSSVLAHIPAFRAQFLACVIIGGGILLVAVAPWSFVSAGSRQYAAPVWTIPILALVIWLLLSTPFSNLAPWIPALGSQQRMDGTLVQAMWFLLVLVAAGLAATGRVHEHVIRRYALVAALATAVWAFLQGLGLDPLTWLSRAGVYFDIPAGAFGHGALASAFIVFVMLLCWTAWIRQAGGLRSSAIATFVLGIGVAAAGGRAAIVGLVTGAGILLVLKLRTPAERRLLLTLALAAVLGAFTSFAIVPRTQRQAMAAGAALTGTGGSVNDRVAAWKGGVRLLAANPIFGVGAEGFLYGVWEHLSPDEAALLIRPALGDIMSSERLAYGDYQISGDIIAYTSSDGDFTVARLGWDKAHNYLIDLGLTAGIPAAVFFVLFVILAQVELWRSESMFAQGVAVGWVSFLVFGTAWFGTISLDPAIWALVGAGLGSVRGGRPDLRRQSLPHP